jgi:hypothetical protein
MQASWSRAVGLLVWALSVLPAVAAEEGVVRLRALSGDAIAGIPVVVELQIANPTASAITTFDLDDPAIARIFWTWRTASGKTLDVRMRQYHFSVIPEPAFPRKLQVPPQGMVSRFHTVPTPLDFPSDEAWVLGVKIRDPIDQTLATAEVSYTGHAGTPSGAIDPEIAQAALLEYSRADVLDHQVPKPVLAELSAAPQGRDPRLGGVGWRAGGGANSARLPPARRGPGGYDAGSARPRRVASPLEAAPGFGAPHGRGQGRAPLALPGGAVADANTRSDELSWCLPDRPVRSVAAGRGWGSEARTWGNVPDGRCRGDRRARCR